MFGAPKSTTAPGSLFGSISAPTSTTATSSTTPFSFGTNPSSTTTTTTTTPATSSSIPTNSLFGGLSSNSNTSNTLFQNNTTSTTNNTLQQQQQQQPKSYLDLESCLPDTKVPHFIVTPTSVTRSTVPANFFQPTKQRDDIITSFPTDNKSNLKNREPLSNSLAFNERSTTLPTYLTSFENGNSTASNNKSPISNITSKKRVLEEMDLKSEGRNVLAKKNGHGVFTRSNCDDDGFDKNLKRKGNTLPPVNSLKDVGMVSQQQQQRELSPYISIQNQSPYNISTTSNLDSSANRTRVRVFGYDNDNIEKIIKHFTSIGPLSEPYITQGNWITFNYTSSDSAKKAISFNGMNIDQNHLIGVTFDERAQEIENLQYQTTSNDLFTKSNGFMNLFNQPKQQEKLKQHQDNSPNLFDKLKEKLLDNKSPLNNLQLHSTNGNNNDEGYVEQRFDEPSFMSKWTDDQKAEFAYQLLLCIPASKTVNVLNRLSPLLNRDFISLLPNELAIKLLYYLDIKSLITMTRVSKRWKILCEDSILWKELFCLKGWNYNKQSIHDYLLSDYNSNNYYNHIPPLAITTSNLFDPTKLPKMPTVTMTTTRLKPFKKSTDYFFDTLLNNVSLKPTQVYPSRSQPSSSNNKETLSHLIIERSTPSPLTKRYIKYDETAIFHYKENEDIRYINWKRLYRNRIIINKRWKEGKCKTRHFPSTIVKSIQQQQQQDIITELEQQHNGGIYCLQFNQSILVTGSRDKYLKIWNIKSGQLNHTLSGHTGSVLCLQFDEKYLITGSSDSTLIIWNINTGEKIKSLIGHNESVLNVKLKGITIVSCSKDRTVKIWNLITGDLCMTLRGHKAAVNAVQFKNDIIVSASGDRTIKIWNINTGKCLQTLDSHSRGIACVEYDGQYIISGSSDQTIRVWNATTGECIHTLEGHTDLVRTLQLDAKSNRIVSGSYDGTLKIWSLSEGKLLKSFNQITHGRILNLQFDFGRIICCSNLGKIIMYDFTHGIDTQFLL